MDKRKILACAVVTVLAGGFLEDFQIQEAYYSEREKRITFIAPNGDPGYWTRIAEEIVKAAETDGMDVKCVSFREPEPVKQVEAVESAIWSGVDGIITAGIKDTPDVKRVIAQAEEAGIPVVLVDTDMEGSRRSCYVGADNYAAGKQAGRDMTAACKASGNILVIVSNMDNCNQIQRVKGFQEIMEENAGMEIADILEGNSNEIYIRDEVVRILEKHPEINGIFCAEGYGTLCMGRLKSEAAKKYDTVKLVGFDGDIYVQEFLKNGLIDVNIQQDTEGLGRQAAQMLKQAMDEQRKYEDCYVEIVCLQPENYEEMSRYGDGEAIWHIY